MLKMYKIETQGHQLQGAGRIDVTAVKQYRGNKLTKKRSSPDKGKA
jgi:hypothetical protein